MKQNNIRILSDVEHVLKRTGRYLGSTKAITQKMFLFENNKMSYKEISYVPALIKIIREIMDNSIDEYLRTKGSFANEITILTKGDSFVIEDNGRGIPVNKIENGMWSVEAAFTELKAGSNFDDDADNVTIGQNGEGSSLVCILSKYFEVNTADGNKHFTLICENNLSSKKMDIKDSSKHFTRVSFTPDYGRFNLTGLDDIHKMILETEIFNLSVCYPKIKFNFNGKKISSSNFEKYVKLFANDVETLDMENLKVAVFANEQDDFNFVHYINGVNCYEGGNPFGWTIENVLNPLTEILSKKYKTIKKGDIKNKLSFIVFFRNMPNPRFDNQVKSKCINNYTDFKDCLIEKIDFEKFAKTISKNEVLVNPIIETFRIKEELQQLAALEKANGVLTKKQLRSDKYIAPIKQNKYLFLCEGDSAVGGISAVMGRTDIGYYSMRGVPKNGYECSALGVFENKELKEICQILGLSLSQKELVKTIKFENIVLAQDADADGAHISGLLIGFFKKHAEYLLRRGVVKRLRTPLIVIKKKDVITEMFFTLKEFNEYTSKNDVPTSQVFYKKGLGSWEKDELKFLITKFGRGRFIESLDYDHETDSSLIHNWINTNSVEARKVYLRNNQFDLGLI